MRRTSLACMLLAGIVGCTTTNEVLLDNAAGDAGLPSEVEGFRVVTGRLRATLAMFHYVRATPPAEFWVLRFARNPAEQKPEALTDLDSLLNAVEEGKKNFAVGAKTRLLRDGLHPVSAAYYSFEEEGEHREGCFCVWEEPGSSFVYALNCIAGEKPTVGLLEVLLRACGAE